MGGSGGRGWVRDSVRGKGNIMMEWERNVRGWRESSMTEWEGGGGSGGESGGRVEGGQQDRGRAARQREGEWREGGGGRRWRGRGSGGRVEGVRRWREGSK